MATERTHPSIDRLIGCIRALKTELGPHYRVKSVGFHEIAVIEPTSHDLELKIEFEPEAIDPLETDDEDAPKDPGPYKFDFSKGPIAAELEPGDQVEAIDKKGLDR